MGFYRVYLIHENKELHFPNNWHDRLHNMAEFNKSTRAELLNEWKREQILLVSSNMLPYSLNFPLFYK